ncbi:MAG TPA: hypothetical protein VJN89_05370 [Candidatus Acidoferrum sp.]|nr:hypothetical protein [Candidatus Acidoferrum sp.]
MKRRILCIIMSFLLLSTVAPFPPPARACGPFFTVTVFIQRIHPDLPLEKYAAGELGIVQPSYPRSYQFAAYRYFVGKGFDAAEQQQLVTLWQKRLQIGEFEPDWRSENTGRPKHVFPVDEWLQALQEVTGEAPHELPNMGELRSSYVEYRVCGDDAFRTAAATLRSRAKEFGPRSEATLAWLDAQEVVFGNCGGGQTQEPIPDPAPAQLPAKIRADRAYQIAAAHFYLGHWDKAENRFLAIAKDPNSPWQKMGAIVALRCRIRQATLEKADPADTLKPIEARLDQLDADPNMREMKPAIHRLKGFVEFRTDPDRYAKELAQILANDELPASLMQDLDDYSRVLDATMGDSGDYSQDPRVQPQATAKFGPLQKMREGNDLTDWLLTFEAGGKDAEQHAMARWEETKSPAWLVAALSKATKDSPKREELLQEAAKIPHSSKAYDTAQFHRLRLLEQIGKSEEARAGLDAILNAHDAALPISARNAFLALRMKAAVDFDDFLKHALRRPSVVTTDMDGLDLPDLPEEFCQSLTGNEKGKCLERSNPGPLLDSDAARIFTSKLPTELLLRAAKSPHLNPRAQKDVAQAAFARVLLLKQDAQAKEAALIVSAFSPALKAGLSGYLAANNEGEKQFSATLFLLHHPEFHLDVTAGLGRESADGEIDSLRYNWWCANYGPRAEGDYSQHYNEFYTPWNELLRTIYPDEASLSPIFLTQNQKAEAGREWDALVRAPSGVPWLGDQILAFAKDHPDDARVPQALHLLVRASRYACFDVDTGRVSKAAFQLLHRKYPSSEWTKKTPYWFGQQP